MRGSQYERGSMNRDVENGIFAAESIVDCFRRRRRIGPDIVDHETKLIAAWSERQIHMPRARSIALARRRTGAATVETTGHAHLRRCR